MPSNPPPPEPERPADPVTIEHPPKLVRDHITPWRDARVRPHYSDPLPAIESFQKFLDHERVRMRRRLYVLSVAFLGMLVCTVFVSMILGMSFMERVDARFNAAVARAQTDTAGIAAFRAETESRLRATDGTQQQLADGVKELQADRAALQKSVTDSVTPLQQDVTALRELARELRDENQNLRKALRLLQERLQDNEQRLAVAPPVAAAVTVPVPMENSTRTKEEVLTMSIVPAGGRQPISWRFPVSGE